MTTELTSRQTAAIAHRGANLLVEAVPGSGKTRVIVARCVSLVAEGVAPERILVLTFSRRAAGELEARLAAAIGAGEKPEIRTFHGFAARLLADAGEAGRSRRLLSEPAERALFAEVVATTPLSSVPAGAATSRLFRDLASARVDELRRSPADALARLSAGATPRLRDLIDLDAAQKRSRDRLGVADFDDLVARAARLAATPATLVAKALRERYRHVLVDEFQDTDPLQLALLARIDAEIFAVGDEAQAIYGFRGAARDAMTAAETRLRMTRLPLDESFRCPVAICDLARSVWPEPIELTLRATATGEIAYRRAASPRDEAAFVADAVAAELAAGVPESGIAVLLRRAEPMATLVAAELAARGIAVARQGGENVLDDLAVDAVCAALGALATPADAAVWVRLFSHPAVGIDALAVRLALASSPPSDVEAACASLEALGTPSPDAAARVASALRSAHAHWMKDEILLAARVFAAESGLLAFVVAGDEDRARTSGARIATFLDALGDVSDTLAKLGAGTTSPDVFAAFVAHSENWRAGDERAERRSGIAVLTVHAAKGLEFDFVAIADAVEGHFPQAWKADALLSPGEIALARTSGVDLGTIAGEHDDEERSLWYVAVTRSQRKLLVTWSETDSEGSPLRPSRFVPLDARTAEAAVPSHRGTLTFFRAPDLTDPQPETAARLRRPIRTSAMETWFACRRKFYYSALLNIASDERGFGAKLGTLVHDTIAVFHRDVREFRAVAAGAHAAWAASLKTIARAIVASVDFEAFDSPLETSAALRSADRLLDRYARDLETSARAGGGEFDVVAMEERVRFAVGGVEFAGRIDRVDRRADGTTVLVDVKTAKLKDGGQMARAFPKLAEAADAGTIWSKGALAGNPQLPLYRRAKPETGAIAYLYLGSQPKFKSYKDDATPDVLDVTTDAAALAAIDEALVKTFFEPWTTGGITSLEPTRNARTCRFCEFETVCPGYLEDDD